MKNEITDSKSAISRKNFICAVGLGALSIAAGIATPSLAFADEASIPSYTNGADFEVVPEEEIDRLWEDVLARARQNGDEIVLNRPHPSSLQSVPYSSVSATVQANAVIGAVPDVIYILARYENRLNATRIGQVYDIYAYGYQSTCERGSYSHVVADGGRSLVVHATVTMRNIVGLAQSLRLFGEFGPTGGNFLKISYI